MQNYKHMKRKLLKPVWTLFFLLIFAWSALGQPPPPPPGEGPDDFQPEDEPTPVGPGIGILLALGLGYGAKKVYDARKKFSK